MAGFLLIPNNMKQNNDNSNAPHVAKWKSLDLTGVGILTGEEAIKTIGLISNDNTTRSRSHTFQLCYHIGIKIRLGFCEGTCTSSHLDFDVGGILLL